MAQAKVLNEKEVRKVLLYIASRKHSTRNRAMFTLLNATGMRVGELASLRLCDCRRRLNIDPPCRSNIDPGRVANF